MYVEGMGQRIFYCKYGAWFMAVWNIVKGSIVQGEV